MARPKSHKQVEFVVSKSEGSPEERFKTFDKAAAWALSGACSGATVYLDVLIWGRAGARWYGGDEAVERYMEDPDASVFERYEIKVNAQGRVA